MTWRRKEPGHQQPCYGPWSPGIMRFQHQKGYQCFIMIRDLYFVNSLPTKNVLPLWLWFIMKYLYLCSMTIFITNFFCTSLCSVVRFCLCLTLEMTGDELCFVVLNCWIFFRKHKNMIAFSLISPHWCGAGSWNPSSRRTRSHSSCKINTMAAEVLAT